MHYSIQMYLSDMNAAEDIAKKAANIFAFKRDVQSVVNGVYEGEQKVQILKNIAESIFHQVRWSRRSMGLFLDSEEFKELFDLSGAVSPMCDLFDKWTLVYNLLIAGITSGSDKRIRRAYELMNRIMDQEKELVTDIAGIIGCTYYNTELSKELLE